MNCAECKEILVAYIEGLLDQPQKQEVAEHLNLCPACSAEVKELMNLQGRLVKNGNAAAQSALEDNVMNEILREQNVMLKAGGKAGSGSNIWRNIMKNPIIKLAAAAAIIVVAFVGVSQFFGGTVTFADVIQPILNARTTVFDLVIGKEETGPVIHDIVVDSRIRRTISNINTIMIIDLNDAKMLILDPQNKSGVYADIKGPLQEGTRNFVEFVRRTILDVKDLPIQELGLQDIDGYKAIGFKAGGPNEEITIWANPQTARAIRIELLLRGQSLYIIKNIEIDVPIDESLVSMEVPTGYTYIDKQLDMRQFSEQDFVTVLGFWAEHLLNGNFPQSISVEELMNLTSGIGSKIDQLQISDDEKAQLGAAFGRGVVFFQQLDPTGVTWHYAGAGVKLGDAEKAIFWYQPKGSQTYRVIYGDLSVEDVAPEDFPE